MADRKRTVVVARFTVEVELDADAWARLTKEQRTEVAEAAEEYLDQDLAGLTEAGFWGFVGDNLEPETAAALGQDRVELTWDSEDVPAVDRDTRPEYRD